jgi:hypothetical protein
MASSRPRARVVVAPVAFVLFQGIALARSSDALAYRPFDGTDADVAAHGEFELELAPVGYLYDTDGPSLLLPQVVFNYGVMDRVELVIDARHQLALGTPHLVDGVRLDRSRILDTDALVKIVLRKGSLQASDHEPGEPAPSGISVAMELGPLLPELGGSASAASFGASDDLIASMRWHDVAAHLNTQPMFDRQHRAALFESVILEGPFRWKVRPVSELAFQSEWYGPTTLSALGGAIARVTEGLDLDLAGRALETDGHAGYEVRAGFTWAIAVHEPESERQKPGGKTPEGEKP